MGFVFVYAGTRQPLPAGTRVYGVEIGSDKLPKAGAFKGDVQSGGQAGGTYPLGFPRSGPPTPGSFEPSAAGKYQVVAIPASQDFGSASEAYHALRRCPPLSFADGRMPAVMLPGLRPDNVEPPRSSGHTVRFRATAKDGEELVSSAIALHDAGPGPRLALARWSERQVRCGQVATLKVFVRSQEGSTVRFEVEAGDGSAWKAAGSASSVVKDGAALAQWLVPAQLLPPAKDAAAAEKPGTKIRFHAIGEFENLLSAPMAVLPPAPPVQAATPPPQQGKPPPAAPPAKPQVQQGKPPPAAPPAKPPPQQGKPPPAAPPAKPPPQQGKPPPAPPPAKPPPPHGKPAPAAPGHARPPAAAKPAPAKGGGGKGGGSRVQQKK
jgi:hypothetical protein